MSGLDGMGGSCGKVCIHGLRRAGTITGMEQPEADRALLREMRMVADMLVGAGGPFAAVGGQGERRPVVMAGTEVRLGGLGRRVDEAVGRLVPGRIPQPLDLRLLVRDQRNGRRHNESRRGGAKTGLLA